MPELRVRGQEVTLRISRGGAPEATLTAIRDFNCQFALTPISQGYLGETTQRKDEIFNGVNGSFAVDAEGQEQFILIEAIINRARRLVAPNVGRINAVARFAFPNGDTPRLLIPDMKFGAIPLATPGREAYVSSNFSFEAESPQFLLT